MSQPLRVRFAPSPTGSLHVGGARTALFNYLVARSTGGKFILRIEDTDASRNRVESEAAVIDDMHWLGLSWDEGPDVGGDYGPYRQSERGDTYVDAARRLQESGAAYECFCTAEELTEGASRQRAAGIVATKYDGTCRFLDEAQRARYREEGRVPALRFRIPSGRTVIDDVVHGRVDFDNALLGDFVLVRSIGTPTYNFAAALDDALMNIDVVIRGDEHLPNAPLQTLLLTALELQAPRYAHVPLILNENHEKLSKRHNTVGVAEYRRLGYLPEAMRDHLVLLGWSPGDETEHFELDDLIKRFSLERVGRSASVYNAARLRAFNGRAIRALTTQDRRARLAEFLRAAELGEIADSPRLLAAVDTAFGAEIAEFAQVVPMVQALFADGATTISIPPAALPVLSKAHDIAAEATARLVGVTDESVITTAESDVVKLIPATAKSIGLEPKVAYQSFRAAVFGEEHGPPLAALVTIIGLERVTARLAKIAAQHSPASQSA